jgi:hypothetical protein
MVDPLNTAGGTPPLVVVGNVKPVGSGNTETGSYSPGANLRDQNAGKQQQQFSPGQSLEARVIGRNAEGGYTLEAGGMRLQVQSGATLTPGQLLNVQVLEGEDGLMLVLKKPDASQFLARSLATGGSSLALQTIFGGGLAKQAAQGLALSQGGQIAQGAESSPQPGGQQSAVAAPGGQPQNQFVSQGQGVSTAAGSLATLQQQFIGRSSTAPAGPPDPQQFAGAVNQVVNQIGQQMAPLLASGQTDEALAQLSGGLRSLAQFFPPQTASQGLSPGAQQLFQVFSSLNQTGATGTNSAQSQAAQMAEGSLSRLVTTMGAQLSTSGGAANLTGMLTSLQSDLVGLQSMAQVPSALQGISTPPTTGLDALFAWNLTGSGVTSEASAASMMTSGAATGASTGEILQQLVQGLGLDMEKLLAKGDVEGASHGLKFQLGRQITEAQENAAAGTGTSASLRTVGEAHQTLQSIDFLQVLQGNLEKQGVLVLPLPLPFLQQGFLMFENYSGGEEKEGREGATDNSARFSVLMKLSSLGNIRVDFLQTEGEVYVRFHTSSKEVSHLLQENQQELRAGLRPLKVLGPSFTEQAEDPISTLLRRCEGELSDGSSRSSFLSTQV